MMADGSLALSTTVFACGAAGRTMSENAQSAAPDKIAADSITADHPQSSPMKAWVGSATIAPNGQLICNSDIASTISRPSNQSVVNLVATSTTMVAPTPPIVRAASASRNVLDQARATPESAINASPASASLV